MNKTIRLNVAGKDIELSSEMVIEKLKGAHLGEVRTHAVLVDGVLHPVKKAFAAITGIDVLDFNTMVARAAFSKLGFKVLRES